MKTEIICKYCQKPFMADNREIKRGNATFCSRTCVANYSNLNRPLVTYKCENCNTDFESNSKNKPKFCCKNCKTQFYRKNQRKGASRSIKSLYKQIKNIPCAICDWKESSRDIHHILPVSKGGNDDLSNLIILCPNHHRMVHNNLISEDILKKNALQWTISSP